MPKFRKKPVVIEAFCFDVVGGALRLGQGPMPDWLHSARNLDPLVAGAFNYCNASGEWRIQTLESAKDGKGAHIVSPGDWIIQGVRGELYPCKPDIFEATYEPVKE